MKNAYLKVPEIYHLQITKPFIFPAISDRLHKSGLPTSAEVAGLTLGRTMLGITSGGRRPLGRYLDRLLEKLQNNLNRRLRHTDDFCDDLQDRSFTDNWSHDYISSSWNTECDHVLYN